MQCRSVVRGFSLATKSWHEFEADGISEVEWNDKVRIQSAGMIHRSGNADHFI